CAIPENNCGSGLPSCQSISVITNTEKLGITKNLRVFPNPTNGVFTVQSDFNEMIEVQIMDVLGKQVYQSHNIIKGTNEIDASPLSKGMYILKFEINGKPTLERLIIK